MKKIFFFGSTFLIISFSVKAQTTKDISTVNQFWLTYLAQIRLNDKWELAMDLNLRTREEFIDEFSLSLIRIGGIYYLSPNTKVTLGYVWAHFFEHPTDKYTSLNEHRPFQQIQWFTKYRRNTMRQGIRLEERFRNTTLKDSAHSTVHSFNYRLRYVLLFELPLSKKENMAGAVTLIVSDEVMFNFGSGIVNNYFEQNRIYAGVKFQTGRFTNLQVGYLNIFQPLAVTGHYLKTNAIRLTCIQDFDLRKKK